MTWNGNCGFSYMCRNRSIHRFFGTTDNTQSSLSNTVWVIVAFVSAGRPWQDLHLWGKHVKVTVKVLISPRQLKTHTHTRIIIINAQTKIKHFFTQKCLSVSELCGSDAKMKTGGVLHAQASWKAVDPKACPQNHFGFSPTVQYVQGGRHPSRAARLIDNRNEGLKTLKSWKRTVTLNFDPVV